jgi:hypothetical protein
MPKGVSLARAKEYAQRIAATQEAPMVKPMHQLAGAALLAVVAHPASAGLVTFDEVDTASTDEVVCTESSGGMRFNQLSPVKCSGSIGVYNATAIYGQYDMTESGPNAGLIQRYPYDIHPDAGGRFSFDYVYLAAIAAAFKIEGIRDGEVVNSFSIGSADPYGDSFSSLTAQRFDFGWKDLDSISFSTYWINSYFFMDNLGYTPVVPEPSAYLLALVGLAVLGAAQSRWRKSDRA